MYKKRLEVKILAGMHCKGNLYQLLIGMLSGSASIESSMEIPPNTRMSAKVILPWVECLFCMESMQSLVSIPGTPYGDLSLPGISPEHRTRSTH